FLYSSDRFQKPYPFQADVAVSLDDVFEQKVDALTELVSQTFEGGAGGTHESVEQVPTDPVARREWLKQIWVQRQSAEANQHRQALIHLYGETRGESIKYAEAFEI